MSTLTVATTLAMLAAMLSPLVLKYVKLDGLSMSAISYLAALVIAVLASLATGDLRLDRNSLLAVLGGSTAFWAVQQAVYVLFKQVSPAVVQQPKAPTTPPTIPMTKPV